jgi:membrane-bound lytic murein transglycosylase MltF
LWLQWESDSIEADRTRFMFASYNAGRGTLRSAQKMAREQLLDPRLWPNIEAIAPRVPRWRHVETIGYVRKIGMYLTRLDDRGRVVTDDVTVRGLKR